MPDPNRAFSSYQTVFAAAPSRMDIGHYDDDSLPDATLFPVGHEIWNNDDEGPNWSNGTAWYGPSADGGYADTEP